MKCSRRSSVHFTGRPSRIAANGTRISSGHGCMILTPKPPPTSGRDHLDLGQRQPELGGDRGAHRRWRSGWRSRPAGLWSSGSQRACTPRPSSGMEQDRSIVRSNSSACGAAAIAGPTRRRPPAPGARRRCPGTSSCTACTAARAASMPDHRRAAARSRPGSGRRHPRPGNGSSATTMATGSPTWLHHVVGQRVAGARRVQRRVRDQHRQRLGGRPLAGPRRCRSRPARRRRARR